MIFIKNPQLGKAKTRLAKTLGDEMALEIYLKLLNYTRNLVLKMDCDRELHYSSFVDREDEWDNDDFLKEVQEGDGLGEKMQTAFEKAFKRGYQRVIIIGSDCADLETRHLDAAFAALEDHDFVTGPALDGGYYLLGMKTDHPSIFQNKNWSTETVHADTLRDIQSLHKSHYQIAPLSDIDHESDLPEWLIPSPGKEST